MGSTMPSTADDTMALLFCCRQCNVTLRGMDQIQDHIKEFSHRDFSVDMVDTLTCNMTFNNVAEAGSHITDFGHKQFRPSGIFLPQGMGYSTSPAAACTDHSDLVLPGVKKVEKTKDLTLDPHKLQLSDEFKDILGDVIHVNTDLSNNNAARERSKIGMYMDDISNARNLECLSLDADMVADLKERDVIAEYMNRDEALQKVNLALSSCNIEKEEFMFSLPRKGEHAYTYDNVLQQICLRKKGSYFCTPQKALRIGHILLIIKDLLEKNKYFRLRTLYYTYPQVRDRELDKQMDKVDEKQKKKLEKKQLDRLYEGVGEISAMLEITREALHLHGSPHGSIKGPIHLCIGTAETLEILVDCSLGGAGGNSVPVEAERINVIKPLLEIDFVLLVEKDTVFYYLANNKFHEEHKCVLVTGRGEADIYTRALVRKLKDGLRGIPIYGLTDANPGGVSIFSTFRHGSEERAYDSLFLTVPDLEYIGLFIEDVPKECTIKLTENDVTRINNMLEKEYINQLPDLRRNLKLMKDLGCKADIDMLMKEHQLEGYIERKIEKVRLEKPLMKKHGKKHQLEASNGIDELRLKKLKRDNDAILLGTTTPTAESR